MNVLQGLFRGDVLSTQQPWFSQKLCCTQNPLLYRPTLSYTSALPRVLSFMLLLGRLLRYSLLTALKSRVGLHPRPSLRPQLYALAWLAGLLLSTLFFGRTSYRGFGWCHHRPQQPSPILAVPRFLRLGMQQSQGPLGQILNSQEPVSSN